MDYSNIIANNGNWPAFSDVFKKQLQFQDYIAKFSDYRNNIAHGRPMPELARMNGEVALLWFSSVLPSDEAAEDQSEEEQ